MPAYQVARCGPRNVQHSTYCAVCLCLLDLLNVQPCFQGCRMNCSRHPLGQRGCVVSDRDHTAAYDTLTACASMRCIFTLTAMATQVSCCSRCLPLEPRLWLCFASSIRDICLKKRDCDDIRVLCHRLHHRAELVPHSALNVSSRHVIPHAQLHNAAVKRHKVLHQQVLPVSSRNIAAA